MHLGAPQLFHPKIKAYEAGQILVPIPEKNFHHLDVGGRHYLQDQLMFVPVSTIRLERVRALEGKRDNEPDYPTFWEMQKYFT